MSTCRCRLAMSIDSIDSYIAVAASARTHLIRNIGLLEFINGNRDKFQWTKRDW
jgi:hypothetical protein